MKISNAKNMKSYMLEQYPKEGCGFIVDGRFVPCENKAKEPELDFVISSDDYLKCEVQAVVHSHTPATKHPKYDIRTPSYKDMQSQKAMGVAWGIVGVDGENCSDPIWWGLDKPANLMDRPYIPSVYDCLTLACDYYKLHFNITLPTFPRPAEWDRYKKTMITDGIEVSGFTRMSRNTPINKLQHGDFVLMKIQANYVNHVGVINEEGKLLHQFELRYPQVDHLPKWDKNVAMYLRHKELQ